jgi:hypothetical protein
MAKIKFGDDHAVSEVFGAILLILASASILAIGSLFITANMDIANANRDVTKANVEFTQGFVDWVKNQGYVAGDNSTGGNSSNPPPLVKYSYDLKSGEWTILLCKDVGFPAVKLSMNATGVVIGGGKIIPPVGAGK